VRRRAGNFAQSDMSAKRTLARLGVVIRTRTRRSRAGLNALPPLRGWRAAGQATSRNRIFAKRTLPPLARLDSSGPGVFAETGFLAHVVQPGSVACPDERG